MITLDEPADGDRDDELATLLRPGVSLLAPPEGAFQNIRRRAARRRLVHFAATAGAGAAMAVAAITIAVWPSGHSLAPTPVSPLAPPGQSTSVTPTPGPVPSSTPSTAASRAATTPNLLPSAPGRGTPTLNTATSVTPQPPNAVPSHITTSGVPSGDPTAPQSMSTAPPPVPSRASSEAPTTRVETSPSTPRTLR